MLRNKIPPRNLKTQVSEPLYETRIIDMIREVKNMRVELNSLKSLVQNENKNESMKIKQYLDDQVMKAIRSMETRAEKLVRDVEERIKNAKGLKGDPGATPVLGVDFFNGEDADEEKITEQVTKNVRKIVEKQKNSVVGEVKQSLIGELKDFIAEHIRKYSSDIRSIQSKVALGGGMGMPVKFSFSGDDSTTEFILPVVPTGEGLAIWAYYNGQWLQPGTHFTVNQTRFTTTFTAETGSTIEGFLIQ